MKKLGLIMTAVFCAAVALAQTTTTPVTTATATASTLTPAEKTQMQALRKEVRAYDNQKAIAKADISKAI